MAKIAASFGGKRELAVERRIVWICEEPLELSV